MNTTGITYLPHAQINFKKWDECIDNAPNGLIYGYSYYLNHMAENWDALLINDYEAVMPLIWNKKMGIRYCYQPPFMQQGGWFGKWPGEFINQLVKKITSFTRYGDWVFNYGNAETAEWQHAHILTNYILDLKTDYNNLRIKYKTDLLNNLKIALKHNMEYHNATNIDAAIQNFRSHYGNRMPGVKEKHYHQFSVLCHYLQANDQCIIREIKDEEGYMIASALLLSDSKRIYNVMNTNTEKGRRLSANHFLFDCIIKEFAGSELFLDFEGSDLPGVKSFYENFGPMNESYYHWHYNNLPFPVNLLKK